MLNVAARGSKGGGMGFGLRESRKYKVYISNIRVGQSKGCLEVNVTARVVVSQPRLRV